MVPSPVDRVFLPDQNVSPILCAVYKHQYNYNHLRGLYRVLNRFYIRTGVGWFHVGSSDRDSHIPTERPARYQHKSQFVHRLLGPIGHAHQRDQRWRRDARRYVYDCAAAVEGEPGKYDIAIGLTNMDRIFTFEDNVVLRS